MLYNNLKHLSDLLSDYLEASYKSPEKLVEISSIKANQSLEIPNKIIISLLNIEKEVGMGNYSSSEPFTSGIQKQKNKSWYFNVYFIMSAVFDEKRYPESIEKLSTVIEFLQSNQSFQPKNANPFIVEPVTYNLSELNSIWSMFGGHHYPSFFGKIKLLTYDGRQTNRMVTHVKRTN